MNNECNPVIDNETDTKDRKCDICGVINDKWSRSCYHDGKYINYCWDCEDKHKAQYDKETL